MKNANPSPGDKHIVISKNGPYTVYGDVPLRIQEITADKKGNSWDWTEGKTIETTSPYQLCRCGYSGNKPFCDGSHATARFDGTETATHASYAQQAEEMEGPTLILRDAEKLCAFARFCDVGGKIWNLVEQSANSDARELTIREAMLCPSGRLTTEDKHTHHDLDEVRMPSIDLVQDPVMGCSGPLWVQGGIPVLSEDGKAYEIRNKVTLCRCGASDNKPFCNGSHASMKFNDGFLNKH